MFQNQCKLEYKKLAAFVFFIKKVQRQILRFFASVQNC